MPASEVRCPGCRTALRPAPGPARINRCPACGGDVPIPASSAAVRAVPAIPRPRTDDDPLPRPTRRPRDDDDDDDDIPRPRPARRTSAPKKAKGNTAIIAAVVGIVALGLVGVGTVVAVSMSGKSAARPAVAEAADSTPSLPAKARPAAAPDPVDAPPAPPIPAGEVIPRVKQSTVYIRTHYGNDMIGMGSGFFAGKPGYVVTNAHVVGYTREGGYRKPQRIEVITGSGETHEKTYPASLYGFDATLGVDLAMLKLDAPDSPPPLPVGASASLRETEEVMIFGYPLGEMLQSEEGRGPNVSVNKTTVSSLRKENGKIVVVQVAGGMQKGNSGGPVVNQAGQVIGVSVAIISGTVLNFAIPGELVTAFLEEQYAVGGKENLSDLQPARTVVMRPPGKKFGPGQSLVPPDMRPGGAPGPERPSFPTPPAFTLPPGERDPSAPSPPTLLQSAKPLTLTALDPDGKPRIIGSGSDPEFRDVAKPGGVLVGLDIGLSTLGGSLYVRSVRPVYRTGSTDTSDTPGTVRGIPDPKRAQVKLRAKSGYAVGAAAVKGGLAIDGLGLVFMKVKADGKLDPTDSYDSPWVGSPLDGSQVRLDGGGTPISGVVGRTGGRGLTGFGIVTK